MMATVYLGLGGNLGDRRASLASALARLAPKVAIEQVSSLYETEPVGYRAQAPFLNAVARGETALAPRPLLAFVKSIEASLGREPSFRNAPRPIDLDILFYADLVVATADLTIPHPRLAERAFVLVPLAEIAPELRHPALGRTVQEMLAAVSKDGLAYWGKLESQ